MNCIPVSQRNVSRDNELRRSAHDRSFLAIASLLFFCSAAATIMACASMAAMSGMPMPGGWTMSMAWMRMSGQSWITAATSFVGMWTIMMVAMMMPSLIPMLSRYRSALIKINTTRLGGFTVLAGAGYFLAWTLVGIAIFPFGTMLAALDMQIPALARITPILVAMVVMCAGAFQFTARKVCYLTSCREMPKSLNITPVSAGSALRNGLRFGEHCIYCCANLTLILLVVGVMDLSAMVIVSLAISAERLASGYRKTARVVGVLIIVLGIFMAAGSVLFY